MAEQENSDIAPWRHVGDVVRDLLSDQEKGSYTFSDDEVRRSRCLERDLHDAGEGEE